MNYFIRHYRPKVFVRSRGEIVNSRKGAVSYLLVPVEQGVYDYWVNITPTDIQFSAGQTKNHLTRALSTGVIPWGRIVIDERPVLEILNEDCARASEWPTQINSIISYIEQTDISARSRMEEFIRQSNSLPLYKELQ